jgi:BioD-like phosphotransacetylase family protein
MASKDKDVLKLNASPEELERTREALAEFLFDLSKVNVDESKEFNIVQSSLNVIDELQSETRTGL